MAKVTLNGREETLVCMALRYWVERCKSEAAIMDTWQEEYAQKGDAETATKCGRNAAASRQFEAEAETLYKRLLAL